MIATLAVLCGCHSTETDPQRADTPQLVEPDHELVLPTGLTIAAEFDNRSIRITAITDRKRRFSISGFDPITARLTIARVRTNHLEWGRTQWRTLARGHLGGVADARRKRDRLWVVLQERTMYVNSTEDFNEFARFYRGTTWRWARVDEQSFLLVHDFPNTPFGGEFELFLFRVVGELGPIDFSDVEVDADAILYREPSRDEQI